MSNVTNADLCLQHEVEQLIYREAYLLDMRRFDEWLNLYSEDAEYLIPAWINETTLLPTQLRSSSLSIFIIRQAWMIEFIVSTLVIVTPLHRCLGVPM